MALRKFKLIAALGSLLVPIWAQSLPDSCYWTSTVIYGGQSTFPSFSSMNPLHTSGASTSIGSVSSSSPSTVVGTSSSSTSTLSTSSSSPTLLLSTPVLLQAFLPTIKAKRAIYYAAIGEDNYIVLQEGKNDAATFTISADGFLLSGQYYTGPYFACDTCSAPLQLSEDEPPRFFNWTWDGITVSYGNTTFCFTQVNLSAPLHVVFGDVAPDLCLEISLAVDPVPPPNSSVMSSTATSQSPSATSPPTVTTTESSISSASASLGSSSSSISMPGVSWSPTGASATSTSQSASFSSPAASSSSTVSPASPQGSLTSSTATGRSSSSSASTPGGPLSTPISHSSSSSSSAISSASTTMRTSPTTSATASLTMSPVSSSHVFSSISTSSSSSSTRTSSSLSASNSTSVSAPSSSTSSLSSTPASPTSTSSSTFSPRPTSSSLSVSTSNSFSVSISPSNPTSASSSLSSSSHTTTPASTVSNTLTTSSSTTSTTSTSSSSHSTVLAVKRGLAYANVNHTYYYPPPNTQVSWTYNYYYAPNSSTSPGIFPRTPSYPLRFIPLLFNDDGGLASMWPSAAAHAIANYGADALFSFNEPDLCVGGSACMTVTRALTAYNRSMQPFAGQSRLVAPSVTNAGSGFAWLRQFLGNASLPQWNLTIDIINIHWYASPYNMQYFIDYMTEASTIANGRSIWITEYGMDANGGNPYYEPHVQQFMKNTTYWCDQQPFIERYAWFGNYPNNLLNSAGTALSARGQIWNSYVGTNYVYGFPARIAGIVEEAKGMKEEESVDIEEVKKTTQEEDANAWVGGSFPDKMWWKQDGHMKERLL